MKLIFVSARSASFELENTCIYYNDVEFDVTLNGQVVIEKEKRNVFSLYDLEPNTNYTVTAGAETISFKTANETVTLNVRDFHAKGDGESDDTAAIQAAILCCPKDGRVLIPEGTYWIKPIFLKSDIRIELAKGAILLGETDRTKYPILPGRIPMEGDPDKEYYLGTWEGRAESAFAGLIAGISVENVQIYGEGIIDGNAHQSDWWENDIVKRIAWRPRGIFLNRCRNISLQGITCRNTASWNQHAFFSQEISYIDMKLINPKENPNTDGINPESCKHVDIIGCKFSVGDDCIAIKSGKAEMGKKLRTPCEHVTVRNCLMQFGNGGVTLGSEMSAGLHDITITRCIFSGTDRGLRIKTQRGRGNTAVIDGVVFDNIIMDNVKTPLVVNMFYKSRNNAPDAEYKYNPEPQIVDERTPYLGSFTFRNMTATDIEWAAGIFWGLPEQPIGRVHIENVTFAMKEDAKPGIAAMTLNPPEYCKAGLQFSCVKEVVLDNVTVTGADGEPYVLKGVENKSIL